MWRPRSLELYRALPLSFSFSSSLSPIFRRVRGLVAEGSFGCRLAFRSWLYIRAKMAARSLLQRREKKQRWRRGDAWPRKYGRVHAHAYAICYNADCVDIFLSRLEPEHFNMLESILIPLSYSPRCSVGLVLHVFVWRLLVIQGWHKIIVNGCKRFNHC